jgi:hypothetical protein
MNWFSALLPILIPVLLGQLKGGAAVTAASFEAGTPVTVASARVSGQHIALQIVLLPN